MGFREGNAFDILFPNAYNNDNIHDGNAFYVQITYPDADGNMTTADAVLSYQNPYASGPFTLYDANGDKIPLSIFGDIGDNSVYDYVKVYDVPENEFGNATAENLDTFKTSTLETDSAETEETDSAETEGTDGEEEQSDETDSEKAGSTGSGDRTYKFTIASVIGQGPIMDPDLLYEKIIEEKNGTDFENFHTKATADSDKVITLIGEIDATLSATNSEAFYTGETAKPNIEKMKTALENTTQGKSKIGSMDSGEVTSIIKTFNEELRGKREETRLLLLKKTINEINGTRIGKPKYEYYSGYDPLSSDFPSNGQRDETGYCVWTVESTYEGEGAADGSIYCATAILKISVDVSGFTKADFKEMENIIEKFQSVTGKGLPYDKSRIVND